MQEWPGDSLEEVLCAFGAGPVGAMRTWKWGPGRRSHSCLRHQVCGLALVMRETPR